MNYLAHLYLAEDSDESILGNLLGDFVKGPLRDEYGPEIIKGIKTHRKVDLFTDSHENFLTSKRMIGAERRRFAGVIIDLTFDHFLAKNWSDYSSSELTGFIGNTYELLMRHREILPEKLQYFLPRMIDEDWLGSYRELDGIGRTLDRISGRLRRRFNRENTLAGAVEEIESNYDRLEDSFHEFFPQVISFVENYRQNGSGDN
ncbi:MAG: ACP phosphodiesterase [Deltaproteobacteria bacterium]